VRFEVEPGGRHAVRELRSAPGELSFDVEIAGVAHTVWFKTDAPVTPPADAALAASLMLAMRAGGTLAIDAPISPRLLRTQRDYQAIQQVWSHDWSLALPPLRQVDVRAPTPAPNVPGRGRGVATFFSGGVDSWAAVLENPDVTHLIFVRGMDIALEATELGDRVEARLREAAAEMGRQLYVVETNLRAVSDTLVPWELYYGCALAACALLLAPLLERVLMTGDLDYEVLVGQGAHPLVDHLWSTENLEVVHANARQSRLGRVRRIADDPVVQRTLRVCWKNPDGVYNCGRCRKCLLTTISLELLGARDRMTTFPAELDLTALSGAELTEPLHLAMWEEVVDFARERGRPDLEAALGEVLVRADGAFELPPSYRRRRGLGPPYGAAPSGTADATAPLTDGEPTAAEAELAARLATVLDSRSWKLTRPLRALAARVRGSG
jgi:hypothetical protein